MNRAKQNASASALSRAAMNGNQEAQARLAELATERDKSLATKWRYQATST